MEVFQHSGPLQVGSLFLYYYYYFKNTENNLPCENKYKTGHQLLQRDCTMSFVTGKLFSVNSRLQRDTIQRPLFNNLGKLAPERLSQSGFQRSMRQQSGSDISWTIYANHLHLIQTHTTPAPHHWIFYRPDALPDTQLTVWKVWRHKFQTTDSTVYPSVFSGLREGVKHPT